MDQNRPASVPRPGFSKTPEPTPTPLFNFKPTISFTPRKTSDTPKRKKKYRSKSKNSTPKNSAKPQTEEKQIEPAAKKPQASPSTPKKRRYPTVVNNFYGVEMKPFQKKVDGICQTLSLGLDLQVKHPEKKSSYFQYYEQKNAPIQPGFYFTKLNSNMEKLNESFLELMKSGNIMDDEKNGIETLRVIFNSNFYKNKTSFLQELKDPRSFEFLTWSHFLLSQDPELLESENFLIAVHNHKMTKTFTEKFFFKDFMDEFLTGDM